MPSDYDILLNRIDRLEASIRNLCQVGEIVALNDPERPTTCDVAIPNRKSAKATYKDCVIASGLNWGVENVVLSVPTVATADRPGDMVLLITPAGGDTLTERIAITGLRIGSGGRDLALEQLQKVPINASSDKYVHLVSNGDLILGRVDGPNSIYLELSSRFNFVKRLDGNPYPTRNRFALVSPVALRPSSIYADGDTFKNSPPDTTGKHTHPFEIHIQTAD